MPLDDKISHVSHVSNKCFSSRFNILLCNAMMFIYL